MDEQPQVVQSQESWINLSDQDVMPANSPERIAVGTAKGGDDLSAICDQVTEQVRQAYILSSRALGPDGTIPSGLKFRAVAIALWRFVSEGVGKNEGVQTKSREAAFKEALEYLDKIAATRVGLATSPSIGGKCHKFGAGREDGI